MEDKIVDCRPSEARRTVLKLSDVIYIETTGKDSDYNVGMQDGTVYIFRCSCCLCPNIKKDELRIG